MSMAEIMQEVAGWPVEQQNKLAAFLLHLRLKKDSAWKSEMTHLIDNHDKGSWVSLEEWKKICLPDDGT